MLGNELDEKAALELPGQLRGRQSTPPIDAIAAVDQSAHQVE
jgi:hypothetical protein